MHHQHAAGQRVELGREPNHPGLLLPDRNNQDNIRWCPGPRAARAREKGFALDKSLTGRRQTEIKEHIDRSGRARIILCRCDSEEAIRFGQSMGITMFQGRIIDKMLQSDRRVG